MPLRKLRSLFESSGDTGSDNPFARALAEHLTRLPAERLEYLAGFAGQLTRVAYSDDDLSEVEREKISAILTERAGLSESEAGVVIDLLLGQLEILRGTEEYRLNRALNDHATREEREAVVDCLFAVAAADAMVSNVEDMEIRKIGHALEIPNERLMDIRGRYRDRLEILKVAEAARHGDATDES